MSYLLVKWVHILSATILFGAGIGSAFHMFMANRDGNVDAIFSATRIVVIADFLFTTPAILVQLFTGVWLVRLLGYEFTDFWVFSGICLFLFAGACWLPVVWIQIKMKELAKSASLRGEPLPDLYWKLNRWWTALGCLAFPAILVVFYLMVFKPSEGPF